MSTNLAFALPAPSRRESEHPRRIEIVTTRTQRRARPRIAYAMIAVGGVFAVFLSQLMLSIALSNGAYEISGLLNDQRDLGRVQGALTEQLELAASTQNLAANAQNLGMVGTTAPAFLRLSDGQVVGAAVAASASETAKSLITNSLLSGVSLIENPSDPAVIAAAEAAAAAAAAIAATGTESGAAVVGTASDSAASAADATPTGAPAATNPTPSVPSKTGALPSPVTH